MTPPARTTSTGCSARSGRPGRRRCPRAWAGTLDAVVSAPRAADGFSATETAGLIGASRITARRYLEYLAEAGLVERVPRYGSAGRPELEYRWR